MVEPPPPLFDVIIAGGGISALAVALHLTRLGKRVLITCRDQRLGGVIQSVRDGDWLLEEGPNSYASFGSDEDELLRDINLASRVLRRPIATTDRYVWHSRRLHRVPTNPAAFLTSSILPFAAKLRTLRGLLKSYDYPESDVTIGGFFRAVLGDAAVDTMLNPAMAGIYAADSDRISLESTLPKLAAALRTNRRLLSAMSSMRKAAPPRTSPRSLTSFPDGLEELPKALEQKLRNDGVSFQCGVEARIAKTESARWQIEWPGGAAGAAHLVLAATAAGTADLLTTAAPQAAALLRGLEHVRLTVAHVGLRQADLGRPLDGFGFLTRRGEGVRMLGSIWSSAVFPGRAPDGHALLTCFLGGDIDPEINDWDDDRLRAQVADDLRTTLGWRGSDFALFRLRRWAPALPVFRPGHADAIRKIRAHLPANIHLAGNYLGGVSIPDRITAARELAGGICTGDTEART